MKALLTAAFSFATLASSLALPQGSYVITTQKVTADGRSYPDRGYVLTIGANGVAQLAVAATTIDGQGTLTPPQTDFVKITDGDDGSFILTAQFTETYKISPPGGMSKMSTAVHFINLSFTGGGYAGGGAEVSLRSPAHPTYLKAKIGNLSKAEQPGAGQPATQSRQAKD